MLISLVKKLFKKKPKQDQDDNFYDAGYKCADTIIKNASMFVAINVIVKYDSKSRPEFHKGMMDRLNKEIENVQNL